MYEFYKPVREMSAPEAEAAAGPVGAATRRDPFAPAQADAHVAGMILEALKDKATDARYMGKLMREAANPEDKEIIRQIRLDTQKHVKMFGDIYVQLTGDRPRVTAEDTPLAKNVLTDYERSIFAALRAAEFYRKIYFAFQNTETRDMLFEIITDEQAHGAQFGYLYAKARQ